MVEDEAETEVLLFVSLVVWHGNIYNTVRKEIPLFGVLLIASIFKNCVWYEFNIHEDRTKKIKQ